LNYQELIQDLKNKKELKDLDENFILLRVKEYLKDKSVPGNKKSREYKKIFKDLRRILRKSYGMFRNLNEKRDLEIYKKIFFKIKPKKILDIGCGLDPLEYSKLIKCKIYCCDISQNIIDKLNNYFKSENIKGKAFIFNLIDEDLDKLPEVELCLMLKVLDSIELFKRNYTKEILKRIKAKYFLISFAKRTLSSKRIIKSSRSWLIRILKELNYNYELFDYENEIYFLVNEGLH